MEGYNKESHKVYDVKYHMIWVMKYRYKVLKGPIAVRARELIRQGSESRRIEIIQVKCRKGAYSSADRLYSEHGTK